MRIPNSQYLCNQSINAETIEFVWKFNDILFICGISKDGSVYLESGKTDEFGDYLGTPAWAEFGPGADITNVEVWKETNPVYGEFRYGKDLEPLIADVVEYLK